MGVFLVLVLFLVLVRCVGGIWRCSDRLGILVDIGFGVGVVRGEGFGGMEDFLVVFGDGRLVLFVVLVVCSVGWSICVRLVSFL